MFSQDVCALSSGKDLTVSTNGNHARLLLTFRESEEVKLLKLVVVTCSYGDELDMFKNLKMIIEHIELQNKK